MHLHFAIMWKLTDLERAEYSERGVNVNALIARYGDDNTSSKARFLFDAIVFEWGMGSKIISTAENFHSALLRVKRDYWRAFWASEHALYESFLGDPFADEVDEDPATLND